MSAVIEVCEKCGKSFEMGVTGTVDGCDNCTGVKRDRRGYAWEPGQKTMRMQNVETRKRFTLKRPKGI